MTSCNKGGNKLFIDIHQSAGVDFNNTLTYTEEFNPYTYRNFFNGAGVALGDVNNDGLLDIYFTGNLVDNKLYLNKGNNQFEDITARAGVACANVWSSGATFADVNGDGYLDLYVCKSGKPEGDRRYNELFINNGDLTFTEKASQYNLNIKGLSTHAAFFDYDKDGDLDVYILTNSGKSVGVGFDLVRDQRNVPDPTNGGNKFLRNDDGVYKDITLDAGIYSSAIGFGLGITLGDFNNDDWTDIFVSNDFFEKDYLYINDRLGGFVESGEEFFQSMSMGSMGADMADLNNDGLQELMVTEMLPATLPRQRTKTMFENWNKYNAGVDKGYYHQFSRNVLQRNVGDNQFLEVGRYAGVAASEWSWGALMFDMNNDGLRDIFISNGIAKDLLDRDYLNYMANADAVRKMIKENKNVIEELLGKIPSGAVSNSVFINKGGFEFSDSADALGLGHPTFSSGSAYGDIDNDGDLDIIINNIDAPAQIFLNQLDTARNRSIQLKLKGNKLNKNAIGAKVAVWAEGQQYYAENYPSRGFQSSMDPVIHIGLGDINAVDSVIVVWPDDYISKRFNLKTNSIIAVNRSDSDSVKSDNKLEDELQVRHSTMAGIFDAHVENTHNDFDREPLLAQMYNNTGPSISIGDIDGDGIQTDVFIGGAKNSLGNLYKFNGAGYSKVPQTALSEDQSSEDVASLFLDSDNDGDMDLYVCSGGRAFSKNSNLLNDRLYINDGKGKFSNPTNNLPALRNYSSSCVAASDIDQDGDLDLFVGERFHPFFYGKDGSGHLLINDGEGYYTESASESLKGIGMVTDATWIDVDGDQDDDLIVVGDWMGIKVLQNEGGKLIDVSSSYLRGNYQGLWNVVLSVDIDNDGDLDFVAGNHGQNSFLKEGLRMYVNDFDKNGSVDHIICHKLKGKYYPIADKDELIGQIPSLKKKIFYYKDYANALMEDLFDKGTIDDSRVFESETMKTTLFINTGSGFEIGELPTEVQYTTIHAIAADDLNNDGYKDLIFGGNQYLVKPQFGRYDGLSGLIAYGSGDGYSSSNIEFCNVKGQIRDIAVVRNGNKKQIIFAKNGAEAEIYE